MARGKPRMASESKNNNEEFEVTHLSVEWKIKKFPFLKDNYHVSSPEFEYLGARWFIDLFMNSGFLDMIILKTRVGVRKIWAYYVIGIKEIDGTIYKSESGKKLVGAVDSNGQTKQFLRQSDLLQDKMRIAPQDVLVVFCNLSLKENHCERTIVNPALQTEMSDRRDASTEVLKEYLGRLEESGEEETLLNAEGTYKLSGDLHNLLVNGTHFDVTIKISGREFRAHRAILGARSPVFESMFGHDTVERNTGTVEIQDCDPDVFEDFLLFLYSGKLKLSSKHVLGLYALADKYDIQDVKVKCVNFMAHSLCVDNFCDFITLALRHNEQKLLKSATDFFTENTKEVILSAKWQCFYKQYPVEANELNIKAIDSLYQQLNVKR